jgi:adenylate cyclase
MPGSPTPRRRSTRRLRLLMFAGTALVLTGFVLAAYAADVLEDSELDTVDARFAIRGELDPPEDIVIVGINDQSFTELGEQWPFPRTLHAEAITNLKRDGARVIAYDVQFTEPSNRVDDNALANSIARAGNVVLATTIVDERGRTNVFGGDDVLRDLRTRAAHAGYATDSGRVVRRMARVLERLETFPVAVVERAQRRQVSADEFPEDPAWIDYHGKSAVRTIPFHRVVRGEFRPGTFEDKIVAVGSTAPVLQDVHPTSVSGEEFMYGVEILANAISTLERGFPLTEAPEWLTVALILLFGAVGPLIAMRFGPLRAALIGLALAGLYFVFVQLVFNAGVIVGFLYPQASLAFGVVGALGVALVLDAFQRERVRDLFSRFVPEPVVDDVLSHVDEDLRLGGERELVTVLFSDIRGFTTFSETREPEDVIEVLNRYLTTMTDVILRHGGTLVSFIGDGILAVFGAPIQMDDHADRAYAAAREMAGPALDEFNEWIRAEGQGDGFRIGVGLNSGAVMAGNVGSEKRLEYTVIGDTTNTASRIEGMTKGTPHMIMLAESTRLMMLGERPELEQIDAMQVRGRQAMVVIWAPAREEREAAAEARDREAAPGEPAGRERAPSAPSEPVREREERRAGAS